MESFLEKLAVRAATLDELLSANFVSRIGQKADSDRAALRLATWCRASASGDWGLFSKRLAIDGLTIERVLARLATVDRNRSASVATWLTDAAWILNAMRHRPGDAVVARLIDSNDPLPFEHLLCSTVEEAEKYFSCRISHVHHSVLTATAYNILCRTLLSALSNLCADVFYEAYSDWSKIECGSDQVATGASRSADKMLLGDYASFVVYMRAVGLMRLFEIKPVLLRLMASVTRQWIESMSEFVLRLDADFQDICLQLLGLGSASSVANIKSDISDLHNFGRSVLLVVFSNGCRVLYKPKDLQLDAFLSELAMWLNANEAPINLRTPRVLSRSGYGWTEYIAHTECSDREEISRFYYRVGAWLSVFHLFVGTDMHNENIIADRDYPVPIDVEMILQAADFAGDLRVPDLAALELANNLIAESVMMTGILPFFARSPENKLLNMGGAHHANSETKEIYWQEVNTPRMRRKRRPKKRGRSLNMPYIQGVPIGMGDFRAELIAGFESFGTFLFLSKSQIFERFFHVLQGVPVRKVLRPTQFYHLLLERLKDHRNMTDGAKWSAQIDFIARFSDFDQHVEDPLWPLAEAERAALVDLNVPFFLMLSDRVTVADHQGRSVEYAAEPGLSRARRRFEGFGSKEVRWQCEIIRLSTAFVSVSDGEKTINAAVPDGPDEKLSSIALRPEFLEKADEVARDLSSLSMRAAGGAAWIGLDSLGDTDVCRLVPLGFDLYEGTLGVAVFLAAHSRATGDCGPAELALAGIAALRHNLKCGNTARFARALGVGGAVGMGSIVYGLTVLGTLLQNEDLHTEATIAAALISDELIAADRVYDVIGGSAGCILGLLKLYRETRNAEILTRAVHCGEHLLRTRPEQGDGIWVGAGVASRALTGMSHGAAGFAYALACLHAVTGREDFASAACDCMEFENRHFSTERGNWPDLRGVTASRGPRWPCQWCHGAGGIGLSRVGMAKTWHAHHATMLSDVEKSIECVKRAWPSPVDTLCCGNLGNIELLNEAALLLRREDVRQIALFRLATIARKATTSGDYSWAVGNKQYNLGLFRGVAGMGYTLLRQVTPTLPNILLWE